MTFTRKEGKERKRGCRLLSCRGPGHTIHSLHGQAPLNKSFVPVLVSFRDSRLKVCVWPELFSVQAQIGTCVPGALYATGGRPGPLGAHSTPGGVTGHLAALPPSPLVSEGFILRGASSPYRKRSGEGRDSFLQGGSHRHQQIGDRNPCTCVVTLNFRIFKPLRLLPACL